MSWIKLDDKCPDHPKVGGLSDRAFRAWVTAMCYSSAYLTDGVLPAVLLQRVPAKVRAELLAAGLWVATDGEIVIHDYLEHQTGRADVERERERSRERRAGIRPADDRRTTSGRPAKDRDQNTEDRIQIQNRPAEGAGLAAAPAALTPQAGPIRHPSPLAWDRVHGQHVTGFCDWFCLPADVFGQMATRLGGEAAARAFAGRVRARFEASGDVPSGRPWTFWESQLAVEFPPAAAPSRTPDALAGVREALARV
jgi:hypothetical protein